MNQCTRDTNPRLRCAFHPKQAGAGAGVCAVCLHERLSILASERSPKGFYDVRRIFSLAGSRDRIEHGVKQKKLEDDDENCYGSCSSLCSQDESFISIKFEANGKGSWDVKEEIPKMPLEKQCDDEKEKWNKGKKMKPWLDHRVRRWWRRIGWTSCVPKWSRAKVIRYG